MTYEDFLNSFIRENKCNVTRDNLFGGYDIPKYDSDRLSNKCYEFIESKMTDEFPRPDYTSEEYHDYFKTMKLIRIFCEAFEKYANTDLKYMTNPPSTEVYHGPRD